MKAETGGSDEGKWPGWPRTLFMLVLSAIIVLTLFFVLWRYPRQIYGVDTPFLEALIPFATCLAGVLLFIMGISRRRRETWDLKKYLGEHCYRVAQAFAYLFIVLWAWPSHGSDSPMSSTGFTPPSSQAVQIPPNILGFLVGFFILRVERAMESLGEKFEEVLMSILPRSVTYMTIQEQRRQILRDTYKLEDVATKYEVLRPMIENEGVRQSIDEKLTEAMKFANAEEPEKSGESISALARSFEDARQALNEGLVPLNELLKPKGGE